MPCYQIRTYSVELATANRTVLEKAIKALGLKIVGNVIQTPQGNIYLQDGKATCSESCLDTVNKLRIEYSKQAISYAANKLGWQKSQVSAKEFVLKKGYG